MANTISNITNFPEAKSSYQITTDGTDCLIIKNVEIQAKLYDIKIWAKDLKGHPMTNVTTETLFPKDLIRRAAQSASTLFRSIASDQIAHTKVWFSEEEKNNQPNLSCHIEDLAKKDSQKDCIFEGADMTNIPADKQTIVQSAQEIHSLFFSPALSFAQSEEMIRPSFEVPSSWRDPKKPQQYTKGSKPASMKFILQKPKLSEQTRDIPVDEDTKSKDNPGTLEGAISKDNKKKKKSSPTTEIQTSTANPDTINPLHNADQDDVGDWWKNLKGPNGITYEELQTYSNQQEKNSGSNCAKPYETFQKLLKDLDDSDSDSEEMYGWLQQLYEKTYLQNKKSEEFYKAQNSKLGFDEWCKDRAARSVASFIQSDIDSENLVKSLSNYIV